MLDLCGHEWNKNTTSNDIQCIARARWKSAQNPGQWVSRFPVQLGGLAQSFPRPSNLGWSAGPTAHGLTGCLSHFTVNGEVRKKKLRSGQFNSVKFKFSLV